MNLIVSDFDGTFFDENYLKNIEFIKSLNDEYDFVIATGRNYDFLKKDLKIECKYYICNDGGYILDSNKNVIYNTYISDNTIKIIDGRIKKLNYTDYFYDYINHFDKKINHNINKVSIKIKNDNPMDDLKYLTKNLNDIYAYISTNWINILGISSKKENAIEFILKSNNYKNVYVVGNEINDYGMLKKYNGYLISNTKNEEYKTINNFLDLKKKL